MASWRTAWWYTKAFAQKYRRILIFGIVIGVLAVWVFPRLITLLPQQKTTRFVGRVGLVTWLELPIDIQEKVSAGLTSLSVEGEPIPTIAERWSVEDDGRVFRFLLKPNLRWQDGKAFRPEDVNYNFADVQIVTTENEVVFRLEDAYAPFPVVVSQPLFRQVRIRRFGFIEQTRIIGLGEYQVTDLDYNGPYVRQLVIENDEERLIYRFYASESEALTAFRRGRVDVLEKLPSLSQFVDAETTLNTIDDSINPQQFVAVYFNTADPALNKELRQALNFATRKPGPEDERLRALTPIPPTSWAYNDTNEIEPFAYDPARALEIYTDLDPGTSTQLTLDTSISLLEEAQNIAADWEALGDTAVAACVADGGELSTAPPAEEAAPAVDVEDDTTAEAAATDADEVGSDAADETTPPTVGCERFDIAVEVRVVRDLQNFQAVLIGREAPADPDQYVWWHSNQGQNISNYQNPRVDKLLEDARTETDQQRRKVMYFEFQRYLVDDVPAMFLYYVPEYTVERPNWF